MEYSGRKSEAQYSLRITSFALKNLDQITGYIAFIKHEPQSAIKVGDRIFEKIEQIGNNPLAFRECEEIPTKSKLYRKAICLSWQIVFRVRKKQITVLGIIHSNRKRSYIKKLRKIK